jgi:hypothetical protein
MNDGQPQYPSFGIASEKNLCIYDCFILAMRK